MRVYFKNLDGIRFIAALLVVLHHAQFFKIKYHVGNLPFLDTALNTGRTGVNLFFVLSGFLISYLLMRENQQTGTISLRNFYMRRILRIWPLYLAYGIGLTVLAPIIFKAIGIPAESDLHTVIINLVFVLLFAVNFQLAFFPYNKDILEITWSVCVEEQFYLLWPVLMLTFRKHLKTLFLVMIGVGFLSKLAGILVPIYFHVDQQHMLDMTYLMLTDKLELFGTGMFAAYIWFHQEEYAGFLHRFFTRPIQAVMLVFTILIVFNVINIHWLTFYYLDNYIHAFCFGYLMIAAVSENSILNLEQSIMKTMGKISYGVYMYHPPISQLILLAFLHFFKAKQSILVYDILFPACCVAATGLVAYGSYELYEKHFLKIKNRFAIVKTRI